MSKLTSIYFAKKNSNPNLVYLFHSGVFYLFLEEDAVKMHEMFDFKITPLSTNVVKCGFPESAAAKYFCLLDQNHIAYEVIELKRKNGIEKKIVKRLREIKLKQITPMEALEIIYELQEMLPDEF